MSTGDHGHDAELRAQSSPLKAQGSQLIAHNYFGFDSAFLLKLERLSLLNRRPVPGSTAGSRRSPHHGSSVEFTDFREYAEGDDLRRVDWNAYARLDRLFLRLYSAEEVTTVSILLDHSSSMQFGKPPKSLTASRLAAVFSFIALHSLDRLAVLGWGERIDHYLPPQGGTSVLPQVWRSIADLMARPAARTDFAALRDFGAYRRGPGLAIVLTDFLTDTDWRTGLRALRASGQEVTAVQILAPEELRPRLRGDWTLRDVESDASVEVTVSARVLERYGAELAAHTAAIRDFCRQLGIAFVQLPSDISIADSALASLRSAGVLA